MDAAALLSQDGKQTAEVRDYSDERARKLGLVGPVPDVPKSIHEGDIGESNIPSLHTATDEYAHASALGPIGKLVKQTRLADSCIPGDERDGSPALLGPLDKLRQQAELLGPADEHGAGSDRDAGKYRAGL
jgi:hypothetical protein